MALPYPTTAAHSRPRGVGRPPRSQSSHTAGAANWGGYCASMKPGRTFSVSQHATRLTERRPWPPRPSQRITTHPAFARGTKTLGHTTCYEPTSLTESPSSSVQDGMRGDQQPLQPRTTWDPHSPLLPADSSTHNEGPVAFPAGDQSLDIRKELRALRAVFSCITDKSDAQQMSRLLAGSDHHEAQQRTAGTCPALAPSLSLPAAETRTLSSWTSQHRRSHVRAAHPHTVANAHGKFFKAPR